MKTLFVVGAILDLDNDLHIETLRHPFDTADYQDPLHQSHLKQLAIALILNRSGLSHTHSAVVATDETAWVAWCVAHGQKANGYGSLYLEMMSGKTQDEALKSLHEVIGRSETLKAMMRESIVQLEISHKFIGEEENDY